VAENLGVQFFTDAKTQYDSAAKWRWVVVTLLAYLHVGLVAPFAAYTSEQTALDHRLTDNRAIQAALRPVLDTANNLGKRIKEEQDRIAEDLKSELVERFQRLNAAIGALAALDPSQAEGPAGAAVFGARVQQQVQRPMAQQIQRQIQGPTATEELVPMNPQLRGQIARTATQVGPGEVPQELVAYIESELIPPPFAHANEAWAMSGLSIAQEAAIAIAEGIAKAKGAAPSAVTDLDRLDEAANALSDEAQHLTFAPPPNPSWWQTVGGKGASIRSMMSDFATSVGHFNTSEMALQKLTIQIDGVISEGNKAAAKLSDDLKDLDKRSNDLQSQLGEISAPLKVVSFRLSEIAPLMSLIIAITLAAIATWTAEGLRRMTLAAGLVGGEVDRAAVRTWLHAAAGGSRVRIAGVELAVAVASVAWVLAAALNVGSLPSLFLAQWILTVMAVAIVVAARAYRWRCADEAASIGAAG
jgi:hypothetical protein